MQWKQWCAVSFQQWYNSWLMSTLIPSYISTVVMDKIDIIQPSIFCCWFLSQFVSEQGWQFFCSLCVHRQQITQKWGSFRKAEFWKTRETADNFDVMPWCWWLLTFKSILWLLSFRIFWYEMKLMLFVSWITVYRSLILKTCHVLLNIQTSDRSKRMIKYQI